MADYPDFSPHRITQNEWDYQTLLGNIKWLRIRTATPIQPGETREWTVYTVPEGKNLYWLNTYGSVSFRAYALLRLVEIALESDLWLEAYDYYFGGFTQVIIIPGGTTIKLFITNEDIVPGHGSIEIYAYEK